MPFSLTNAPVTFNRMMDIIFRPLRHCVGTFFDDMIVFSKSEAEHMEHLRAVFEMLRKERVGVNEKKSELFMEEIHFLGHIVSKDGVRMDPTKIKAIQDWPEPVNLHGVCNFLGLCSYYRRVIRFFAEIAAPLHDLMRKALVRGEHSESYSFKDGFLMFRGKLCVSQLLRQKVMTESHSPPYAGHRGIDLTIKALDMYLFWPSLRKDTESFVRSCLVCQRVKYDRGKAYGLLQPLPISKASWESIAMDFICGLSKTSIGNEGIWMIVD
ncbi:hypothetical protein L7F22_069298 [Adiantum nelumboides]|nr:hypothetical protein [Adiantum nelumboides]